MRYAWTLIASTTILLTGCSVSNIANQTPVTGTPAKSTAAIKGRVHGGQQPLQGASIYLYKVSAGGYGSGSTSVLTAGTLDGAGNYYVTTDSNGIFTIANGGYTCTSGDQDYLYSLGGNPQVGGGVNADAGLIAVLGDCANFANLPASIILNEVTTVAAAYALSGFAADSTHISSGTTTPGINKANAALSAANLASLSTGAALATTPAGNGAVPQSKINSLANIIAACVNTGGPTGSLTNPNACDTLFADIQSNGATGATPADTATAAIYIAHNPSTNVTALYNIALTYPQFMPVLSGPPNDWTMAVSYSGGGLAGETQLAIDASGDVWVTDTAAVSEFNPVGSPLSPAGGYTSAGMTSPYGIAIDPAGNVWVANHSANTISELNQAGLDIFDSPVGSGGLSNPSFIAIDGTGNLWVTNNNEKISNFSSTGTALSSTGFAGGGLNDEYGIATTAGSAGDVWVADATSGGGLSEFNLSGVAVSGSTGDTNGGFDEPISVAVDGNGYAWSTNYGNTSISAVDSTGTPVGSSPFTGGGLTGPYGIAIDGGGNVWIANIAPYPGVISEFSNNGTAITGTGGYTDGRGGGGLAEPNSIAVDGAGNVWVSDDGNTNITEFVGAGVPVVTPLSVGAKNNTLGTKP